MRLAGKRAIITGAASGIGCATALRFAEEGAAVACVDRDGAGLEHLVSGIGEAGGTAFAFQADVTDEAAVTGMVEQARAALDGFDIVVNNAGVTILGGVAELSSEAWDREIDTNLTSVFRVSKAAWPHLAAAGGGVILSTASIAGVIAVPQDAAYVASKAGLITLTKCMALDGAADGIRVNCICPGYVDTPMYRGFLADRPDAERAHAQAMARTPLGRIGTPRDVADGFVYLASEEATWITGIALVIDGGLTAGLPPS